MHGSVGTFRPVVLNPSCPREATAITQPIPRGVHSIGLGSGLGTGSFQTPSGNSEGQRGLRNP